MGPEQSIYACDAPLEEAVVLSAPVRVFGGLDCASWQASDAKTPWTAAANTIPLIIEPDASGSRFVGFDLVSAPGEGFDPTTDQGASSIALWVQGADVALVDMNVSAGTGAAGNAAEAFGGQADGAQDNPEDFAGNVGGGCAMSNGGAQQTVMCTGSAVATVGAAGGVGQSTSGMDGAAGAPVRSSTAR